MNYGFQLAASGALTSLYRMEVLANNLANVNTVGFKPDLPAAMQRDPERVEDGLSLPSNRLLERLGGGVFSAANRVSFEPGPIQQTGNPLDLAIEGEGFFVVQDDGELRLTRDGRFTLDPDGNVVSATSGLPLLDTRDQPIKVRPDAPVTIEPNGVVRQNGDPVGHIQVAMVPDVRDLSKLGGGLFAASAQTLGARQAATGKVHQKYVEGSAVDPLAALMAINDAARAAEGNSTLLQGHDRLLDRAINGLGRTI